MHGGLGDDGGGAFGLGMDDEREGVDVLGSASQGDYDVEMLEVIVLSRANAETE